MNSFADAINLWPSLRSFAEDIGVDYGTAQVMKHRDSVSDKYWLQMVEAAAERRISGVTLERLAEMKAARREVARDKKRAANASAA
jgi:hypothetical protein